MVFGEKNYTVGVRNLERMRYGGMRNLERIRYGGVCNLERFQCGSVFVRVRPI